MLVQPAGAVVPAAVGEVPDGADPRADERGGDHPPGRAEADAVPVEDHLPAVVSVPGATLLMRAGPGAVPSVLLKPSTL
jgi:hypothetical protein